MPLQEVRLGEIKNSFEEERGKLTLAGLKAYTASLLELAAAQYIDDPNLDSLAIISEAAGALGPGGSKLVITSALKEKKMRYGRSVEPLAEMIYLMDPRLTIVTRTIKTEEDESVRSAKAELLIQATELLITSSDELLSPQEKIGLLKKVGPIMDLVTGPARNRECLSLIKAALSQDALRRERNFPAFELLRQTVLRAESAPERALKILAHFSEEKIKRLSGEDYLKLLEFVYGWDYPPDFGKEGLEVRCSLLGKLRKNRLSARAVLASVLMAQNSICGNWQWQDRLSEGTVSQEDLAKFYAVLEQQLASLDLKEASQLITPEDLVLMAGNHERILTKTVFEGKNRGCYQESCLPIILRLIESTRLKTLQDANKGIFKCEYRAAAAHGFFDLLSKTRKGKRFLKDSPAGGFPRWISLVSAMTEKTRRSVLPTVVCQLYSKASDKKVFIDQCLSQGKEDWIVLVDLDEEPYFEERVAAITKEGFDKDCSVLLEMNRSLEEEGKPVDLRRLGACVGDYRLEKLIERVKIYDEEGNKEWLKQAEEQRRQIIFDLLRSEKIVFKAKSTIQNNCDLEFLAPEQSEEILAGLKMKERLELVEVIYCQAVEKQPERIVQGVEKGLIKSLALALDYLLDISPQQREVLEKRIKNILSNFLAGLSEKTGIVSGRDTGYHLTDQERQVLRKFRDTILIWEKGLRIGREHLATLLVQV